MERHEETLLYLEGRGEPNCHEEDKTVLNQHLA